MQSDPSMRRRSRFFFFPLFLLAGLLLLGWVVMLLWNAVIPAVFPSVKTLQYGQAVGLLLLCRILVGSFRGRPPGGPGMSNRPPWRERWSSMNEEERARFREAWKNRCQR